MTASWRLKYFSPLYRWQAVFKFGSERISPYELGDQPSSSHPTGDRILYRTDYFWLISTDLWLEGKITAVTALTFMCTSRFFGDLLCFLSIIRSKYVTKRVSN